MYGKRYLLIRDCVIFLFLSVFALGSRSGAGDDAAAGQGRGPFLCGTPRVNQTGEGVKIIVTNDVHGYIFQDEKHGRIGYALLRGYIDSLREEGFVVYLVDAGDAFSGSAVAQFDSGRSVAALMGETGYRLVAPGNHAFDYNASEANPLHYSETLLSTLAARAVGLTEASCLNLTFRGGPVPGIHDRPVVLLETPGLRLVVCGIMTPYTEAKSNAAGVRGYGFGLAEENGVPDHAATRRGLLAQLEAAVAQYSRPEDVVVVLSHIGYADSGEYADGQITGRDLAAVANVDAVADAHSHSLYPAEKIGDAWYGNAGRYLENFAEITIRREGAGVQTAMVIKGYADIEHVSPNTSILESLRTVSDRLGLGDELFFVDETVDLSDRNINSESTPLGRFLCREMLAITQADLALYNSGGIRSGIGRGWATTGDMYDMLPFQNNLVVVPMSGSQIETFFQTLPPRGGNAFPQMYGMKVYAWEREGGGLGIAGIAAGDGVPLEAERTYSVAVNSYMAFGGDGYSFSEVSPLEDYGDCVAACIASLKEKDDVRLADLSANDTLLVYPAREEAERAWEGRARDRVCPADSEPRRQGQFH